MKNSRRYQLVQHIAEITSISLANREYTNIMTDAFTISLDLHLDRANISRMLNDLWRENELIKIQGRPTFYLHRKTISKKYPNHYIPALIPKSENLEDYLAKPMMDSQEHCDNAFFSCIGNSVNESLYQIIQDVKVYLAYPQYTKSILVHGPCKTGKKHLIRAFLQYYGNQTQSPIEIDCKTILLHKVTIADILDKIDFELEQDGNKVIFFENLQILEHDPAQFASLVALLTYYQQVANHNELNILFVATVENLSQESLNIFDTVFQKLYTLPSFDEKLLKERYEFILYFMQQEADFIQKTISLSTSILNCFATSHYSHNIQSLKKEIHHSLSYAYAQSIEHQESFISIDYHHLSDELLGNIQNVIDFLPQIESITSTLKEKNHFLIPETECLPLQKLMITQVNEDGIIRNTIKKDVKISDYCKQELRNALSHEINQLYSLSLRKVKSSILPILKNRNFIMNEKQLDKLCFHISNLIHLLHNQTYTSIFVKDDITLEDAILHLGDEIIETIGNEFQVEFPDIEKFFLYYYLFFSQEPMKKGSIAVLVACQGNGIAEKYALHVNTMKYKVKCHFMNFIDVEHSTNITILHSTLMDKLLEIDEGSGVIIITDLNPIVDFDNTIKKNIDIDTVTLSPTSLPLLIQIMNLVNDPSIKLDDIKTYDYENIIHLPLDNSLNYESESRRSINEAADKILSDSLVFLNPQKATMALFRVLMQIYEELGINYANDISIRFIFHSAFMIERVIRKEPLIYKNTQVLISENKSIYEAIDKNMQLINDLFGISIPSSEIARISEIFIDLLQETKEPTVME